MSVSPTHVSTTDSVLTNSTITGATATWGTRDSIAKQKLISVHPIRATMPQFVSTRGTHIHANVHLVLQVLDGGKSFLKLNRF